MERNFVAPIPPITTAEIEAAILAVDYTELGDGCTTIATAVMDNQFMVTGTHSFPRAKHFSVREGQQLALAEVHVRVSELLRFRQLDELRRGTVTEINVHRDPSSRTRAGDNGELPVPPEHQIRPLIDDTLKIRITDSEGNSSELVYDPTPDGDVVDAEFNPDVTPVDAEPVPAPEEIRHEQP